MQIRMLREIDAMFEDAPQNRKTLEVKEEMLQNLMEKYNDLLAEGKSEEAAFNIALASVGDISDLLRELCQPPPRVAHFPEPDMSGYDDAPEHAAPAMPGEERHHKALLVSVAIMMYIISPLALILFGGYMGLILLFTLAAGATGLLVYYGMSSEKKPKTAYEDEDEPERKKKMTKQQKRLYSSLSSALWMIVVALYFVISFSTNAWHITWIIFLIAGAATNVLKAIIDLCLK